MLSSILNFIFGLAKSDPALAYQNASLAKSQAGVIKTAMGFKVFWLVWCTCAFPMALWFGWGMLDTLFNGRLPDVAKIPLGLKPYADVVWSNIFFTGAAGAIAHTITSVAGQVLQTIFGKKD